MTGAAPDRSARPRLEQTTLHVSDITAAADFYIQGFGMAVLDRQKHDGAASVVLGFDGEDAGGPIELVSRRNESESARHGTGYGHIAIGVEDVAATFDRLEAMGSEVILPPGIVTPGGPCCAFVKDRDGYAVELVEIRDAQSKPTGFDPRNVILGPADGRRRILHTMLRISDVDRAIRFYENGLGMRLLERVDIAVKGGVTGLFVGFGGEAGRMVELSCYRAQTEPYTHGTGFGHIAIAVPDVAAASARLVALGFECVVRTEPDTHAMVKDPDGYAFRLIPSSPDTI